MLWQPWGASPGAGGIRWHRVAGDVPEAYAQLSISSVQFCWSSGYLRRSIMQAAVVVILKGKEGKK